MNNQRPNRQNKNQQTGAQSGKRLLDADEAREEIVFKKKKRQHSKGGGGKLRGTLAVILVLLFVAIAIVTSILCLFKPQFSDDIPFQTVATGVPQTDEAGIVVNGDDVNLDGIVYKRNQDKVNFLVIGRDRVALNTDVMMIVSLDLVSGEIGMMQIPRDTYIEIGTGYHRANTVFATFYNQQVRAGKEGNDAFAAAAGDYASFLEQNLCIAIDYYAVMNLAGFVNIIDAIGGVYMDVPTKLDYDDPYQNLHIHIKAGPQTLSGEDAEGFVRFRHGYVEGDIGRVDAQKLFVSALLKQIKSKMSVSMISTVADQILSNVVTNVNATEFAFFAKKLLTIDLTNINMMTIPGIQGQQYENEGTWYYSIYRKATLEVINRYFNVFTEDITDSIFDPNYAFADEAGSYLYGIYSRDIEFDEIYNADNPDISIATYSNTYIPAKTTAATEAAPAPDEPDTSTTEDETDDTQTDGEQTGDENPPTETDATGGESDNATASEPVESTDGGDDTPPDDIATELTSAAQPPETTISAPVEIVVE